MTFHQVPYFIVELVASSWGTHELQPPTDQKIYPSTGSGTYHDVVRITREDNRATWLHAQIAPILAFVEGVCGYDLYKVEGDWIFRRTVPFI